MHTIPLGADGEYLASSPWIEGDKIGMVYGSSLRIIVACDDVVVVPAPGNPIPKPGEDDAKVMRGGQALRSFRVIARNGTQVGHTG